MAPESERATLESVCAYCRQTIHNVGKFGAPGKPDMWLHEDGTAYCKNTTATPTRPNDPTLTCSEVVERLRKETMGGGGWFDCAKAEAILSEWVGLLWKEEI